MRNPKPMVTAEVPRGASARCRTSVTAPCGIGDHRRRQQPHNQRDDGGGGGEGERVPHGGERVGGEPGQLLPEPGMASIPERSERATNTAGVFPPAQASADRGDHSESLPGVTGGGASR